MKFTVEGTINKPVGDVFAIITDQGYVKGDKKVDPDVVSIEKITEGPIGVGTVWRETFKTPGPLIVQELEITHMDLNREVRLASRFKSVDSTAKVTYVANGDATTITVDVHVTTKPVMGWLMSPMIRRDVGRREQNRIDTLKRMIESGEMKASEADPLKS